MSIIDSRIGQIKKTPSRICAQTAATTVDIPEDWDPRAKQQPTGLIAYGAARRRPSGLWLPASASRLGRRSRLAGHGPNNDSLFLPQAAVVIVAIPRSGCIKKLLDLKIEELFYDPYGNRTHVTAVKGPCLNRLTNGP